MKTWETPFIAENIAPKNAKRLVIFYGSTKLCEVDASKMQPKNLGSKLYSFGALSDVHVIDSTKANFQKSLSYLNNVEHVDFICIDGDLTAQGTSDQYAFYKNCVNEYSPNTPVYEVTGNHDVETFTGTTDFVKPYLGEDLYYSFTQGNDLFIMFGMQGWKTTGETFSNESLQWLYDTLEANRNKRVFLFEHCPRFDGSGNPYPPVPTGDILLSFSGTIFKRLMEHYKNVIWFHGHTHITFEAQNDVSYANYDRLHGCHSVHLPSTMAIKTLNNAGTGYDGDTTKPMGHVVEVYENNIVLRGCDFGSNKYVNIAQYCLDTTPIDIPEKSFTDSTGTIIT